mgnify:CR=1 FL=1
MKKNRFNPSVIFSFLKQALFVLPIAVIAISCGDDTKWTPSNGNGNGSYTPSPVIASRMETPRMLSDGSTVAVSHDVTINGKKVVTYELEYDKSKYHSRWVAFRFDDNTRAKSVGRSDEPFADDPSLSSSLHIGWNGFGGAYNRGHLCASNDRLYDRTANEQTFYMSNMSPQLGSFNQGYWVTLEGQVATLGRSKSFSDTLYVVKGGTIRNDQIITYVTRDNGKKVPVPKYYYMALLKVKNGVYSSIAFWMEHKEYGYSYNKKAPLSEIMKHAITVNELEQKTGIDFFPNLPDAAEEKIEDQKDVSTWGK